MNHMNLLHNILPALTLIEMFEDGTYGKITKIQKDKIKSIKYYFNKVVDTLENEN